ncbi:MAG: DUF3857 and transglutaminase domain-containing protein [Cyclobacteriaceae bacterium]|nr:DUF3857 and transglutaminase domain-containing protein [Cyclobacteriaceae bacterium]
MTLKLLVTIIWATLFSIHLYAQYNAVVTDYSTSIKYNGYELIEEHSQTIQINNKRSSWIADVNIAYGGDEKIEIIEAVILNTNGVVMRKLKKKEITTRSNISYGSFYEDGMIKEFSLKWNTYPYQIKYTYQRTTNQFLYVAHWDPILYYNIPTRTASLRVDLPNDYEVAIDDPKIFTKNIELLENNTVMTWKTKEHKLMKVEKFSPPTGELLPTVKIIPKQFTYGVSGLTYSWANYGNWVSQLNEGLDVLTFSEIIIIDELIKGISDKKEIIKTLYYYMQDNTRYINVAIDVGGLKSYPASYVCKNKYGDCKALTNYMKSMLKHAGIDSYSIDIVAGDNPKRIKAEYPSQQFNHVILAVPLENDTIWLENTSSYTPYNYLGTFTQNRKALLVNGKKSQLINTPKLSLEESKEESTYLFTLDVVGNGELQLSQTFLGDEFDNHKYRYKELQKEELKEYLVKKIPYKNIELNDWKYHQPNRDTPSIDLEMNITLKDQIRNIGGSLVINPVPLTIQSVSSSSKRVSPIRINYPVYKEDSIVYSLPFSNNYTIKTPENVEIKTKYGLYFVKHSINGDKIEVKRSFQLFSGEYPVDEFPTFSAFFEGIRASQKQSHIILKPNQ